MALYHFMCDTVYTNWYISTYTSTMEVPVIVMSLLILVTDLSWSMLFYLGNNIFLLNKKRNSFQISVNYSDVVRIDTC